MFEEKKARELWRASRRGDRRAFDQFYRSTVRILYIYGLQIHPDRGLVEDCIQDLFVGLWKNRANIRIEHSAKQYLFRSLRRLLIRKANQKRAVPTEMGTLEHLPDPVSFFSEKSIPLLTQQKADVASAVEKLPKRQREALFLKYFENLDYEEIAAVMGLKKQGVYKLVSVGIKKLRKVLLQVSK